MQMRVLFEGEEWTITREAERRMQTAAWILEAVPSLRRIIRGFCLSTPSEAAFLLCFPLAAHALSQLPLACTLIVFVALAYVLIHFSAGLSQTAPVTDDSLLLYIALRSIKSSITIARILTWLTLYLSLPAVVSGSLFALAISRHFIRASFNVKGITVK